MSSAVSAGAGSKDRDATVSQEVLLCAAAPPPGSSALGGVEHSDSGSVPSRRVKPRQMVNKLVLERSSVVRDQAPRMCQTEFVSGNLQRWWSFCFVLHCSKCSWVFCSGDNMQAFVFTAWFQSASAVKTSA